MPLDRTSATGSARHLDSAETSEAAWEAARGAVTGAARWGIYGAIGAGLGLAFSPLYRGLTFQFKVFLQMSSMTLGSMIEADQRLRQHEVLVRRNKKIARDAQVWRRYEDEYEARLQASPTPSPPPSTKVRAPASAAAADDDGTKDNTAGGGAAASSVKARADIERVRD